MASMACSSAVGRSGRRLLTSQAASSRSGHGASSSSRSVATMAAQTLVAAKGSMSDARQAQCAIRPHLQCHLRDGPRRPQHMCSPRSFSTARPVSSARNAPTLHIAPLASVNPALYNDVRPPPRAAYAALAHRLKLIAADTPADVKEQRIDRLVQACTDRSYAQLLARIQQQYGDQLADAGTGKGIKRDQDSDFKNLSTGVDAQYITIDPQRHNAALAAVGNSLMGLTATEMLHLRYPSLPNRILKAAVAAYVGSTTLSDVAAEFGVSAQGMVRWDRQAAKGSAERGAHPDSSKISSTDVHSDVLRAIVAVIFQEQGLPAARNFVHTQMLSRLVPLVSLLKFGNPKKALMELCHKQGIERPQSRMIAETGRLSINPIFVVGVFSGETQLGEGTGSAIRMAEYRAAEDALRRHYMSETPADQISLPSSTLDGDFSALTDSDQGFKDIWEVGEESNLASKKAFRPAVLGESEITFGFRA